MKYWIFYDEGNCTSIEAKNIKKCIIQFAEYMRDNSDLFLMALKGCCYPEDYVNMYEHFSNTKINTIRTVEKVFYEKMTEYKKR